MNTIGLILRVVGVVISLNVIIHIVFLLRRNKFFLQFGDSIPTKVKGINTFIQRNDAGFQYLKCDVVISNQTIFLLLKNTLGNITLQYQPIIQLNPIGKGMLKYKYVEKVLDVSALAAEGRLLTVDVIDFSPVKIELQFKRGFDIARLLKSHNIEGDYK